MKIYLENYYWKDLLYNDLKRNMKQTCVRTFESAIIYITVFGNFRFPLSGEKLGIKGEKRINQSYIPLFWY